MTVKINTNVCNFNTKKTCFKVVTQIKSYISQLKLSINWLNFSLDHRLLICKVVATSNPIDYYCSVYNKASFRNKYGSLDAPGACLKRDFPSLTYDGATIFVPQSSRIQRKQHRSQILEQASNV